MGDNHAIDAHPIQIAGPEAEDETSLLEVLDHVLTQGAVIRGNLVISLAGVDLIYLGLDLILTAVETALKHMSLESTVAGPRQG